jgi:hypothetical protein
MKTSRIKSLFISIILLFSFYNLQAQTWTPSTPPNVLYANPSTTTSVGIGTQTPLEKLHLSGGRLLIDNISTSDSWTLSQWKPALITPPAYAWRTNALCAFSKYLGYGIDYFGWHWITSTQTDANGVAVNQMELLLASDNPLKSRLDITGRMRLSDGVIQKAGVPITTTSDLGLYCLDPNPANQIRIVTFRQPIRFYTDANVNPIGSTPSVTIESSGNVGIGTTVNPSFETITRKFVVNGDVQFLSENNSAFTALNGFQILGNNQVPTRRGISLDNDPSGKFNFWINGNQTSASFNFNDGSNLQTYMTITKQGVVGIGTIFPTGIPDVYYKLYVKGGIRTEKVKVDIANANGWADYVFEDGYKLMSIPELEMFIDNNNHLPEIPCAEDVVSNGVELSDMQVKLLKKIEELTLYIIDQNKRIETLEVKMSAYK